MKIVLISGKAEAGKDTVASILQGLLSKTVRVAYGDYVKETAKELWGWDGNKDEAGRALLQWWGTTFVRERYPDFWANTTISLAEVVYGEFDYMFVTDVRFPNEILNWWKHEMAPLTVRVERPGHESKLTSEQRAHISETALDDWRFDVVLTATNIDELRTEVITKLLPMIKQEGGTKC